MSFDHEISSYTKNINCSNLFYTVLKALEIWAFHVFHSYSATSYIMKNGKRQKLISTPVIATVIKKYKIIPSGIVGDNLLLTPSASSHTNSLIPLGDPLCEQKSAMHLLSVKDFLLSFQYWSETHVDLINSLWYFAKLITWIGNILTDITGDEFLQGFSVHLDARKDSKLFRRAYHGGYWISLEA